MGSDKRRLAFKILHSTPEDLEKLERCAEGDECRFLIYVLEEEEQTVYGFAITAKNPRTLNVWRRILSAKTQDKIRDFRQDKAMDKYDQAYYEGFGEVHVKGQYTSQGSRTDCARNEDELARAVKELMEGKTTLSELSEEHPLLYFKHKKVLLECDQKCRQKAELQRMTVEYAEYVLKPWHNEALSKIQVSEPSPPSALSDCTLLCARAYL